MELNLDWIKYSSSIASYSAEFHLMLPLVYGREHLSPLPDIQLDWNSLELKFSFEVPVNRVEVYEIVLCKAATRYIFIHKAGLVKYQQQHVKCSNKKGFCGKFSSACVEICWINWEETWEGISFEGRIYKTFEKF